MIVVIQYNVEESMNDWKTYNLIPSHMHLWACWAYAVAVPLAQPTYSISWAKQAEDFCKEKTVYAYCFFHVIN